MSEMRVDAQLLAKEWRKDIESRDAIIARLEHDLTEARLACACYRSYLKSIRDWSDDSRWDDPGYCAIEALKKTDCGQSILDRLKSMEDLLRQCLHTGALRTDETRQLYLDVCKAVGEEPK